MTTPQAINADAPFDMVDFVIRFESDDEMDQGEVIAGFQHLINTGAAWQLQGFYGRTAQALIEAGHCTPPPSALSRPVREDLIGTRCECGAPYDPALPGYACAR